MKIGLIRHAKVLCRDPFFSNGELFNMGRKAYDSSAVAEAIIRIRQEDFPVCYVSTRLRAIATAKAIYPGNFITTDELVEVTSTAIFLLKMNLPSSLRSVIGRVGWFFNYHKMPETRFQSNERARKFLTGLITGTHQDTLLVTHGFFMQSLRHELRKLGFKGHCPYFPPNAKLYIFEKK
ncbi:MAG: histidine phosphatase family protein [Chitinophagales bacterium]